MDYHWTKKVRQKIFWFSFFKVLARLKLLTRTLRPCTTGWNLHMKVGPHRWGCDVGALLVFASLTHLHTQHAIVWRTKSRTLPSVGSSPPCLSANRTKQDSLLQSMFCIFPNSLSPVVCSQYIFLFRLIIMGHFVYLVICDKDEKRDLCFCP
jgi:hypothetical protein